MQITLMNNSRVKELIRQNQSNINEINAVLTPFYLNQDWHIQGGRLVIPILRRYLPEDFCSNWLRETPSFVDLIVSHMSELGWPINLEQGANFCAFFDVSKADRLKIIDACASDLQYQEYVRHENRQYI